MNISNIRRILPIKYCLLLFFFFVISTTIVAQEIRSNGTELNFLTDPESCTVGLSKEYLENAEQASQIISRYPNVRVINLSSCYLSKIPDAVFDLKHLEVLQMSMNKLKELPDEIGKLSSLRELVLEGNGIKKLPQSIGQLMNLEKLDLQSNQLSTLPSSIVNLFNLHDLNVENNNFLFNKETIAKYPAWKDANGFASSPWKNYVSSWKTGIPDRFQFIEKSPAIPQVYIVTATSGLSVRNKPKLNAKRIGAMPHKLKIAVYEESSKTETIDGITAPWMRIKAVANGKYMEGWAWGGYLEKFVYTEIWVP